jgi:hypothetical protein
MDFSTWHAPVGGYDQGIKTWLQQYLAIEDAKSASSKLMLSCVCRVVFQASGVCLLMFQPAITPEVLSC